MTLLSARKDAVQRSISERNSRFFETEAEKLEGWADDLKLGLEREIKDIDRQIKEARRAATAALTLEEKLAGQKQIKALKRNAARNAAACSTRRMMSKPGVMQFIQSLEAKLSQRTNNEQLFSIRWRLN